MVFEVIKHFQVYVDQGWPNVSGTTSLNILVIKCQQKHLLEKLCLSEASAFNYFLNLEFSLYSKVTWLRVLEDQRSFLNPSPRWTCIDLQNIILYTHAFDYDFSLLEPDVVDAKKSESMEKLPVGLWFHFIHSCYTTQRNPYMHKVVSSF